MKKKLVAGVIASSLLFGIAGIASATIIDFENNNGDGALIGNYYSADNVLFGDTWNWYAGNIFYPSHSGEYTAIGNPFDAVINFINPVSQVSAYFNVYAYELTWQALDASGNLLGSVQLTTTTQPTPGGMQSYSLPYENISKLVISGANANFYNMDDLYFKTSAPAPAPVPEPASMLLMATGLAGLVAARRKKK